MSQNDKTGIRPQGLSREELALVMDWIAENILPRKRVLRGSSSYGLKHLLERDTGVYLTNDRFKAAMLLAGYLPADPDEVNWHYRIQLRRNLGPKRSPFFRWARRYRQEPSPRGDFVRDMLSDRTFPEADDRESILRYLYNNGACGGALDAFEELWREYAGERH